MAENTEHPPSMRESIARGYEVGDVSIRAVLYTLVGFVAFAAISHVVLWGLFHYEYRDAAKVDRPTSALTDSRPPLHVPQLQPAPYHDTTPYEDLREMRRNENQQFQSMGWQWAKDKPADKGGLPLVPDDIVAKVANRKPSTPSQSQTTPPGKVVTPIPGVDQGGTR